MKIAEPDLLAHAEDCVRAAFRFWLKYDFRFLNHPFEHEGQSHEWLTVLDEDDGAAVIEHYPSDQQIALFSKEDVQRIKRCLCH